MFACALTACLLALAAAQDFTIGVVEQPERGRVLACMAEAALAGVGAGGAGGAGAARLGQLEPLEPLAPPGAVCALARGGPGGEAPALAALVGGDTRALRLAADTAARTALPLLFVDPAPANATWEVLQLYPHPEVLAQACAALMEAKGWRRAVLLHEGSARGVALLAPGEDAPALLARRLPPAADGTLLRNLLLVLKNSGSTNFIVWCSAECTLRVLEMAQRVGLLAERHSYITLSLDLHTQPLANYSHGGANITGLRLFDPALPDVVNVVKEWERRFTEAMPDVAAEVAAEVVAAPPTALLLTYVGTVLAADAWARLKLRPIRTANCDEGVSAFHADTLLNYLRSEEWELPGFGALSWEADGGRRALQLQVLELARGGRLRHAGLWAPRAGLAWQREDEPVDEPPPDSMVNRTFTVLIALNKPYVMRRESIKRLSGNERYEGFCIELIEKLAELLKFNYTFVEQPDGVYGSYDNVSDKWTGMLGRLIREKNVDFAITDLTITEERERAVDFTTPFMNLGISIMFHAPKQAEPKLFAFLHPFSNGVWLCLGFAYLGTSLVLYVVGRLCHEEWQNPYPCIDDPPALENQFTLANALWFNLGAVLLQGSEIAPVAYGTRAVAGAWWLFALVITSSYTANLATLLAKKASNEIIHSVLDLPNNKLGIDYGAKSGGSTYTFFQHSENKMYQDMYKYMSTREMPKTNLEGIELVQNGSYAFLMESTTIDYETERNCDVIKVGGLLDSKGYGIAMKKGSGYRQAMNLGLLNLQEAGTLREMQQTWWKEKHGGGACKASDDYETEKLSMKNFMGLFLVLVVGSALGVVLSCCDLAWCAAKRARENGERFHVRFWKELRFVFCFEQSERPLQGSLTGSSRGSGSPDEKRSGSEKDEAGSGGEAGSDEGEALRSLRTRSGSLASRRRSSMHAASLRLARHTAAAAARDHTLAQRDHTPAQRDHTPAQR